MRVAVTGASGFAGGAICRAACDAGWAVHAFGRRSQVPVRHIGGARYRSWDLAAGVLRDPPEVDAVIHCAGSVSDWANARDQWAVNVTGTATVLNSFPGRRIVHISTGSVYDPYRPTVRAVEADAPVLRYLNPYGASKAAAENLVLARRADAVVLRPHAVYGCGDTTLLPRVLAAVRGARLFAVGDGTQLFSLTAVANLATAALLAAESTPRGVFNVTDAEPMPLADALTEILARRRIRAKIRWIPLSLAWPVATAAEAACRTAGCRRPPRLTRYAVSHLGHERTLDITAARVHLGYRPTATDFTGAATW